MSVLGKWTLIFISAGLAGWAASFAQPARKPGTIVEAESCRFEVGTNVDGLAYWSSAFPLFDLSKQAGHWLVQRPGEWDTGEELRLDEGGWPLAIPAGHNLGLILTRESQPPLPQANYQMRLDTNARVRGMLGTQVETAGADAYRLRSAADGSVHLAFEAGDLPLRMKGLSVVRERTGEGGRRQQPAVVIRPKSRARLRVSPHRFCTDRARHPAARPCPAVPRVTRAQSVQTGGRFSRNDAMPSRAPAVWLAAAMTSTAIA